MDEEDDYRGSQDSGVDYSNNQYPETLYADNSSQTKQGPSQPAGAGTVLAKPAAGPSFIHVTVNPDSKIKGPQFVDIINKTPGLVGELKGKVKYDAKTKSIIFPDFSKDKVVPGKEWLFDLGKAGDDWEYTTATLVLVINVQNFFRFIPHIQKGEERGFLVSKDPDDSLLEPTSDLKDIRKGLIVGLTIPNEVILNKNSSAVNSIPPPQIARLKSGKGLILIASDFIVEKKGNQIKAKDAVSIPKSMIAMSCLHELAAHSSFFQIGQDAAHSEPFDSANNVVDRNSEQLAIIYKPAIDKEQTAFESKVQVLTNAMNKAVP